jgi:hypothetical protein
MKLITLDQAREHVKADGDDDELLTLYCNAAEAACAKLANRNLYKSTADLTAAVASISGTVLAAYTAYDAAVELANAEADIRIRAYSLGAASVALQDALDRQDAILHGLALDAAVDAAGAPVGDDILAAILLTVGHLYRNRENVATGQSAAAVEVPLTAQHIMGQHRWIGPL